jgi:beta-glucosidase
MLSTSLPAIDTLSLAQQVAQLFVVRASGFLFDPQIRYPAWEPPLDRLRYYLSDLGVGGVILVDGSAAELMLRTQQLQSWASIPLLISADVEEGVGQRFPGATWFPPPMAIADIARRDLPLALSYAEQMGEFTAKEGLAIGLNWILAPVVDVNNNADNPVINVRAFGQDPQIVSALATAFMKGVQKYPALSTAKHFPGHGDTSVDSHLELPVLSHSPERLAAIELPPFQQAIAAGVDAVMSAHLLIPSWDDTQPATLSRRILTEQLRHKMGFNGLIVTDALVMGAIAKRYDPGEAPILAIEAGADIILMPVDPAAAIASVCSAVEQGRLCPDRIRESVERIWHAKHKIFDRLNPIEPSPAFASPLLAPLSHLATPAASQVSEQILQHSMNVGGPLPVSVPPDTRLRNVVAIDDLFRSRFLDQQTPAIVAPTQRGYQLQIVVRGASSHPETLSRNLDSEPSNEFKYCIDLLQVFVRGNPFGTSSALTQLARQWFNHLLNSDRLQAVVIYGSPYTLEEFLPNLPPHIPYVFSYGQTPQAQALAMNALFGTSSASGGNSQFL